VTVPAVSESDVPLNETHFPDPDRPSGMGLDDLSEDIEATYAELGEELTVELDTETRNELAMLACAYDPDDVDELLRRAVHTLFQGAVETGNLDFHLRSGYDVTYDEYLYAELNDTYSSNDPSPGQDENARRYRF
jgi:hypothetical protein